jgi:hypothetical protein
VEGSCKLGNEPSGSIKCWDLPNGCITCGLSSGTQLHRVSWLVNQTERHPVTLNLPHAELLKAETPGEPNLSLYIHYAIFFMIVSYR